jgi:hypothetical protein
MHWGLEEPMFSGNFYGLIITLLTLVIAVVMTARQVQQTGIRFEVTIQPIKEFVVGERLERRGEQAEEPEIASKPQRNTR